MIRIIGGTHGGRKIAAPASLPVRPTTDFAKEALFNMLIHRVDIGNIRVLDLFSGTGNISYELASRGCRDITAVDSDPRCVTFIAQTAEKLSLSQVRAVRSNVYEFLRRAKGEWDLIFADPPYDDKQKTKLPELVFSNNLLAPGGMLIVEHPERTVFPDTSRLTEMRTYGRVNFSFFS